MEKKSEIKIHEKMARMQLYNLCKKLGEKLLKLEFFNNSIRYQ